MNEAAFPWLTVLIALPLVAALLLLALAIDLGWRERARLLLGLPAWRSPTTEDFDQSSAPSLLSHPIISVLALLGLLFSGR